MKNPTTPREMIAHLQRENAALRDSLDHAETLLCNSLPMKHCLQSDWDKLIRKWRDQKHAIDDARKEAKP